MLKIENLKVNIKKNNILQSINIKIKTGELHVIMGPNGSGKSSLVSTLVGKENYTIKNGKLFFNGINISELNIEERSKVGMLLSFQNPISIAGVKNIYFLHTALNEKLTYLQNETITVLQVIKKIKQKNEIFKNRKKTFK